MLNVHSHSRNLIPVTQLYVSVDASTKESLKRIDRPLFRDFWPRFINSLEALAEKVRLLFKLMRPLIKLIHLCEGSKDSLSTDSRETMEY